MPGSLYRGSCPLYRAGWASCRLMVFSSFLLQPMFRCSRRHTSRRPWAGTNSLKSIFLPLPRTRGRWKAAHQSSSAVLHELFYIAGIHTHKQASLNLLKNIEKLSYYSKNVHWINPHNNSTILLCQPLEVRPVTQDQSLMKRNKQLQPLINTKIMLKRKTSTGQCCLFVSFRYILRSWYIFRKISTKNQVKTGKHLAIIELVSYAPFNFQPPAINWFFL